MSELPAAGSGPSLNKIGSREAIPCVSPVRAAKDCQRVLCIAMCQSWETNAPNEILLLASVGRQVVPLRFRSRTMLCASMMERSAMECVAMEMSGREQGRKLSDSRRLREPLDVTRMNPVRLHYCRACMQARRAARPCGLRASWSGFPAGTVSHTRAWSALEGWRDPR